MPPNSTRGFMQQTASALLCKVWSVRHAAAGFTRQYHSLHSVWHGVLFVRFGIFKDAKLKFKMTFENFPRVAPRVFFVSEVYHPLVSTETGELDLGEEFTKNWNYGSDHLIFNVVEYLRVAFLDVKKYEVTDSFNKKAGELYRSNIDEFFVKVRESVETSKNQVYNNYP